ncbi:MAG TPA: ABC transporter permease [Azospirillaceae bacterium]|nr:ABC transporter permease [Azospirillaceae bacterium]
MSMSSQPVPRPPSLAARMFDDIRRFLDGDVAYSFRQSPVVITATLLMVACFVGALGAPWLAPHNTYDVSTLDLANAFLPPSWHPEGDPRFLLGTDGQGRDIVSAILFGMRVSLVVGFGSILFAMLVGVTLGLLAGFLGGRVDSIIMRVADVQLSLPAILIVLMIDGFARSLLPRAVHEEMAIYVVIFAIGISSWVQFARTVRGSTLVERNKEYVQAARVIGIHPVKIMLRHVLPNVTGPVLVIGTLGLAVAILTEATLSFLGVGVPPTQPSLGTLIRVGNDYLYSGEWWMTIFPGAALVILALSVNLVGDWLRDALNPKLR